MKTMTKYLILTSVILNTSLLNADSLEEPNQATLNKIITSATGFDMPLKDEPRNIVIINKSTLTNKGYQTLDDALKMQPLITFSNNGFGGNIDLRGQGGSANQSVKVLLNRVPMNLLDSSHGTTPLQQINLEDVESIEIIPGGGAVIYGNGTRGGVVNIVTKSHQKDFANINLKGGSYEVNNGLFGRIDLQGGKNIGNLFLKADASLANTNGYRLKDSLFNYYFNGEALYEFSENHSLDFNASYSYSKIHTTPGISLTQVKKDRRVAGNGIIVSEDNLVNTSLNYKGRFQDWDLDILGFYQMDHTAYPKNITSVTQSGATVPFDESGSLFFNQGAGGNLKLKYTTEKNTLIIGYDLLYQDTSRKSNNHYIVKMPKFILDAMSMPRSTGGTGTSRPTGGSGTGSSAGSTGATTAMGGGATGGTKDMTLVTALDHAWQTDLEANKLTDALYVFDKYEFTHYFELSGGARYENSLYHLSDDKETQASGTLAKSIKNGPAPHFGVSTARNNYALEITPNFKYSDSGNVYLKYERGFITPSPNQMMNSTKTTGLSYNSLKPETYDTFELGYRDEYSFSYLSATLYYTLTQDEILLNQITHGSDWQYSNLAQTWRLGLEIIAYQDFFNDRVHLSESISYLYNEISKGPNIGKHIPLVKDYKFTLNLAYDFIKTDNQILSVLFNNVFYGPSIDNSALDKPAAPARGRSSAPAPTTPPSPKIDAYILSNLGLNYQFKHFKLDAGVLNLFDTQYYDYQLAYSSDGYIPASYISAPGRSYYVELRYDF